MVIYPSGHPGIRKRQDNGRKNIQIFTHFPDTPYAFEPIPDPAFYARKVPDPRHADTGILNEQDPVPVFGERGHYLLVSLPEKIPVDRRHADYIFVFQHVHYPLFNAATLAL